VTDLLIPATRALLTGWRGPVVVVDFESPFEAVCLDWPVSADAVILVSVSNTPTPFAVDIRHLRLDLSRAECRDRVARCTFGAPGIVRLFRAANGVATLRGPLGIDFACSDPFAALAFRVPHVPALAALDPSDDTRLADGSRRADAAALARCWEATRG
jgi:hypothetical protein